MAKVPPARIASKASWPISEDFRKCLLSFFGCFLTFCHQKALKTTGLFYHLTFPNVSRSNTWKKNTIFNKKSPNQKTRLRQHRRCDPSPRGPLWRRSKDLVAEVDWVQLLVGARNHLTQSFPQIKDTGKWMNHLEKKTKKRGESVVSRFTKSSGPTVDL